jgi:hypothetical protein
LQKDWISFFFFFLFFLTMPKMELVAERRALRLAWLFWAAIGLLRLCPGSCAGDIAVDWSGEGDSPSPTRLHLDFLRNFSPWSLK